MRAGKGNHVKTVRDGEVNVNNRCYYQRETAALDSKKFSSAGSPWTSTKARLPAVKN